MHSGWRSMRFPMSFVHNIASLHRHPIHGCVVVGACVLSTVAKHHECSLLHQRQWSALPYPGTCHRARKQGDHGDALAQAPRKLTNASGDGTRGPAAAASPPQQSSIAPSQTFDGENSFCPRSQNDYIITIILVQGKYQRTTQIQQNRPAAAAGRAHRVARAPRRRCTDAPPLR